MLCFWMACMEILWLIPETLIEDDKCHSYVFDLDDSGKHHPYKHLREIEDKLFNEVVKRIKEESIH